MALTAKDSGGNDLPQIPEGVYVATCYGVVDLGTHLNPAFGNKQRKVLLQWEIPEVRGEFERDGKKVDLPRAISKRYTVSLSEKANLRKDLEAWRGKKFTAEDLKGFDLKKVLGAACQIQVVHGLSKDGTKTFANVGALMALPKGTPKPTPENPHQYFSFEELPDGVKVIPKTLPEWVTKIIMESEEWKRQGDNESIPEPDMPPMDGADEPW